jgi:hypothetical protein
MTLCQYHIYRNGAEDGYVVDHGRRRLPICVIAITRSFNTSAVDKQMSILSFIKLTYGSIRSRHSMLTGIVVGVIILLTCFTFFLSVDKEKVLGWTYFGTFLVRKVRRRFNPT